MSTIAKVDRREFMRLTGIASGGLILGVYGCSQAEEFMSVPPGAAAGALNAFVQIGADDTVSIWVAKTDMGQGVRTSLPMIVADELDADWDSVRIVQADAHPERYGRMMTVGSSSVRRGAWMDLRRAGAAARHMLLAAAAARWSVDAADCHTESGAVIHTASTRRLSYGELAEEAAAAPVPDAPALKDPAEFRLIGTPMKQLDTPAKARGEAIFGIDVRVPGMLFGTVLHSPVFGGGVGSFDASAALAVDGVREVVEISRGIAVVADNSWAAFEGADRLDVTWDGDFAMSSADISAHFAEVAEGPGSEARREGDIDAGMAAVHTAVEAVYEVPYLAHATMEPMNCTAYVQDDRVEVWAPTQNPQGVQSAAARISGVPIENVIAHPTFLGCGLGRRSATDFVEDAVETSMKIGAPVQVLWSRTEDMRTDLYRPAAYAKFTGGVDGDGNVAAYRLRAVAQPLSPTGSSNGRRGGDGVDGNAVDGLVTMPYDVANLLIDYGRPDAEVRVPTGYWRSVGPSQNCFITESIIDELAHAAGRDPLEFRLSMLGNAPRIRNALQVAAEHAGWGSAPPAGRGRGIGLVIDKGGHVATIVEVSVSNGFPRVHRVTVAADHGLVINPLNVEAQTVGCVVNGLTAALYGEISIRNGRAVQSNFHDYQLLRIDEMPEMSVHIIDSSEEPGGVGEPALPPAVPALTNAVFALTGTRIRKLPVMNTRL
jgi:CO/xanthine dehydrogenase Mo-binding subunit